LKSHYYIKANSRGKGALPGFQGLVKIELNMKNQTRELQGTLK